MRQSLTGQAPLRQAPLRQALRWLAHPVSLLAIVVMVVNDHVLKQAFGTWWTGKLSDVAGLVFFPALVATVLAAADRGAWRPARFDSVLPDFSRLVLLSTALTAVGFTWVKTSAVGAATASEVLSALAGPSVVRLDVTDLLALPALGLAAWVGLGPTRLRPRRARRALGVAAVPLALLASVATGAPPDPTANVVVDNSGEVQAYISQADAYGVDERFTYDEGDWVPADSSTVDPSDYEWGVPVPNQVQDCAPSDPQVCFRIMPGVTGVERSDNGGDTWVIDWQLTGDQVKEIGRAYGRSPTAFATVGLGVVDTDDGFVVIAGNGIDGYALRAENGAWERIGFEQMDCCAVADLAIFGEVDQLPKLHAYPVGLVMGLGLPTLALPFLAAALRRGRPSQYHVGFTIAGVGMYVFGALIGVAIVVINSSYAPLSRTAPGLDVLMLLPLGAVAIASVMAGTALFGLLRKGIRLAALGGWAAGIPVSAVVASRTPDEVWTQAAAGVLAIAAVYSLYVPVARRWWVTKVKPERAAPGSHAQAWATALGNEEQGR